MKFWQLVSFPFFKNTPENWSVVNRALCIVVEDDKENIITACYPEICVLRKDWLCQREELGVRVRSKDT